MVIDVYEQYFRAEAEFNGIPRRAAIVKLTSDSEAGNIRYTVSCNFFPFRDDEDFAVSYDAYFEKEIYNALDHAQKEAWDRGNGYFYWSYKLHVDAAADPSAEGRAAWDLGRSVDMGWFKREI